MHLLQFGKRHSLDSLLILNCFKKSSLTTMNVAIDRVNPLNLRVHIHPDLESLADVVARTL